MSVSAAQRAACCKHTHSLAVQLGSCITAPGADLGPVTPTWSSMLRVVAESGTPRTT